MVNKRERPVLLLDVSRFRGRGDPEDGEGIEPLDLRIVLHRGQEVEEARPSRDQRQHLARPSENHKKGVRIAWAKYIYKKKEGVHMHKNGIAPVLTYSRFHICATRMVQRVHRAAQQLPAVNAAFGHSYIKAE